MRERDDRAVDEIHEQAAARVSAMTRPEPPPRPPARPTRPFTATETWVRRARRQNAKSIPYEFAFVRQPRKPSR